MSTQNQPPPQAVANLPIMETVLAAFASVAGQLGLLAQAAKGAFVLLLGASLLSLALPGGGNVGFFMILISLAATTIFGLNWCRVMLLGPQGLPRRSLSWGQPHWRFLGFGLLLFLITMLASIPLSIVGSVLASVFGMAPSAGDLGAALGLTFTLVLIGMLYVLGRLGFVFPAVAVEENYSLGLAWRHTAGQGFRLTAALFIAGLPLVVAQLLLTDLLLQGLLGLSFSDMMPTMPLPDGSLPPAAPPAAGTPPAEPASLFAVIVFNLISVVINFLCIAFRTCTGWVPAGGGNLPAEAPGDSDADDEEPRH